MKGKLFILSTVLLFPVTSVSAAESVESNTSDVDEVSIQIAESLSTDNEIGDVISNGTVEVSDEELAYFVTYKDRDTALSNFKELYSNQLKKISEELDLNDLTNENYEEYYLGVKELSESQIVSYQDINAMLEFFDIYENDDINKEITNNAIQANKTEDEVYKENIDAIAANYNPVVSEKYKTVSIQSRSIGLPNVSAAVSYAKKYAVNANSLYYKWSKDCTNFVSQILNASGVSMVTTSSENTGWWYKSKSSYSLSWIRSDTFSRYMGRTAYKNSSTKWSAFVKKLVKGDFIGYDSSGDGSVDHMAFITDKSGTQVQIAQHSTDYLKWSDSTGWTEDSSKRVLYIVR